MSQGEIKYAPEGRMLLAEVRFAAGQDLVDARALYPGVLDWSVVQSAPAFDVPEGALGVGYRIEMVDGHLAFPNTPVQIVGEVDLSLLTYGALGPLAGKAFHMQVDQGAPVTVTFASGGGAPANAAAVVARINAVYGSTIATLDGGHHLVLTGALVGQDALISIYEDGGSDALETFGITSSAYRTTLDGLIDLTGFAGEPQVNFPNSTPDVSAPEDGLLATSGRQLFVSAYPSNVDPAALFSGHLLIRVLFVVPQKL